MKSKRNKPRAGRLAGADLEELRSECWKRDKGLCQECGKAYDLRASTTNTHLVITWLISRRNGEVVTPSPTSRTLCGDCHRKEHVYGKSMTKPVPAKEKVYGILDP